MEFISTLIGHYYGIDWLTLVFGLTASTLISNHKVRVGLCFGIVSCLGGMYVASVSGQTGFVVYNALLMMINIRGILRGDRRKQRRESINLGEGGLKPSCVQAPVHDR